MPAKEQAMGEYTAKVAAHVQRALEPCEAVLAASPGAPRGAMRSLAYGNGPRGAGRGTLSRPRDASAELDEGRVELTGFGVPYAPQYVVVLTDRRFCWFRTSFTGRPKSLVAAMPRGDVETLLLGEGRVLGQRFAQLRFVATDGRRCTFEVPSRHAGHAERLVERFVGFAAA
jgi:hypothetical protein